MNAGLAALIEVLEKKEIGFRSRLWIAYSGGLDSTVLLRAAIEVYDKKRISAVHVDHGWSPDSGLWSRECARMVNELGVGCKVIKLDRIKGNLESESRKARYQAFQKILRADDVIATAHHKDDVVESRLWQILTGRAPIGIYRELPLGPGTLWRPLLSFSRQNLRSIAEHFNWSWIEDDSNRNTNFDRNWIRHVLLPIIEERFPRARSNVLNLRWPELSTADPVPLELDQNKLPLESHAIRSWLWAYKIVPREKVVREVQLQSSALSDRMPSIRVSDTHTVRRYRDHLFVVSDVPELTTAAIAYGKNWRDPNGSLTWHPKINGLRNAGKLTLRKREGGERIVIGHIRRDVGSLFRENGIPPWVRDRWPLLYAEGSLISIPGLVVSDGFVSPDSLAPKWSPSVELGGVFW